MTTPTSSPYVVSWIDFTQPPVSPVMTARAFATQGNLPTAIDSLVLLAALTRLGAVQNPIVPIMREREVRYITKEARTEYFVVRPEWRGFDYGGLAEQIAAEIGCTVLDGSSASDCTRAATFTV